MDAEHAEVEILPGGVSGDLLSVLGPDGFQLRPAPDVRLLKILAVVNKFNGFVNFFVVYKTIPGCLVFAELHRDDNMIGKPLPGAKSRIVATNYPCCLNVRRGICLLPGMKDR